MALELVLRQNEFANLATTSSLIGGLKDRGHPQLSVRIMLPDLGDRKIFLPVSEIQSELNDRFLPSSDLRYQISLNLDVNRNDLPRFNLQQKQSRYQATSIQKVNPRYVQVQQELQQTQISLLKAEAERNANPNFGTGFAAGMWQGRVNSLQNRLRETPPYINEPVRVLPRYRGHI